MLAQPDRRVDRPANQVAGVGNAQVAAARLEGVGDVAQVGLEANEIEDLVRESRDDLEVLFWVVVVRLFFGRPGRSPCF